MISSTFFFFCGAISIKLVEYVKSKLKKNKKYEPSTYYLDIPPEKFESNDYCVVESHLKTKIINTILTERAIRQIDSRDYCVIQLYPREYVELPDFDFYSSDGWICLNGRKYCKPIKTWIEITPDLRINK